ncbi:MAG: NADH dehydrogenase FAD-containing subunit, partial [Actinomycetota bacterium]|nr:NADH dehydrogenase FAD-containing subunit [Actinomycetota bacterium]
MSSILVVLIVMPFVVAVATIFLPVGISKILTVISGATTFALALTLVPAAAAHTQIAVGSLLRVDALSVVFLVATAFLYGATAVFAGGYLHLADGPAGTRYGRRFYAGLNLFCWSMVAAPLVNGLALLWVAIEITTVISALLVAIDDTDG